MSARDSWAILRIGIDYDRLTISHEDARGALPLPDAPAAWELRPFSVSGLEASSARPREARVQPGLFDRLREAMEALPGTRYGPHANGPVPLAVFVDPPNKKEAQRKETAKTIPTALWEEAVEELLSPELDLDKIEVVRLEPTREQPRPPFRLPLRILAVGLESMEVLNPLRFAPWYLNSAEAQTFGLHVDFTEPADLPKTLRKEVRDVVVLGRTELASFLEAARKLRRPALTRPRLAILLDHPDDGAGRAFSADWAAVPLPPNLALLRLPMTNYDPASFLKAFIEGIIHDFPLHEATRAAKRAFPATERPTGPKVRLRATPRSNQALRMAEALDQLQNEARSLNEQIDPGEIDAFVLRIDLDDDASLLASLDEARRLQEPVQQIAYEARNLQGDFSRETFGLLPMAKAEAAVALARTSSEEVRRVLAQITADPKLAEAVRNEQDRRVDISLDELDEVGVYRPFYAWDYALRCGKGYRMRLHIGHPSDNSLMTGEVPPIDPLLPEPESREQGHHLEVAVFEAGFTLRSPRQQPLYLPPLGGSKPVFFELRAPEEPGTATLRIGLYHKNNLVQSFLLEADVQHDSVFGDRLVRSRLVLARSARFTNLDDLKPRTLAIGVNQDTGGSTHSIMLKKDDTAAEPIRLTERLMDDQVGDFRTFLEKASYQVKNGRKTPRFAIDTSPGNAPSEDFKDVIRELADAYGGPLYREIYRRASPALKTKLRTLASWRPGPNDEVPIIQITRHDPNFAFPWPVLYDYPLPRRVAGEAPKPVCMGAPLDGPPPAPAGKKPRGCPHNPDRDVYCIEGFWGIRHQIEQLLEKGDHHDDVATDVRRPAGRSAVCLARGIDDRFTAKLASDLEKELKQVLLEIGPDTDLLDVLWDDGQRPALLVMIAHLETREKPGEPVGPRILTFPRKKWPLPTAIPPDKWLLEEGLFDYEVDRGSWDGQPRPVVLLVACGSAATELASLNDFVKSFASAGAGAVVGTECDIFSSLGAHFAREVVLDLWKGTASLGLAMHRFNRKTLASGNPMAFAFSCFGNADITLTV